MKTTKIIILLLVVAGCDDASFSSSSPGKKDAQQPPSRRYDAQQKQAPATVPTETGTINSHGGQICIGQTLTMNIVLVFDRSGSQTDADQHNMKIAAQGFLNNLTQLQKSGKKLVLNASVIRFNSSSEIGSSKWQDINAPTGLDAIFRDIAWANSSNSGGTAYHLALQNASVLFQEIGAQPKHKLQRNYVVFLSDGAPGSASLVMPAATDIVNQFGAVFFTIGVGVGSSSSSYLEQMAALVNPDSPADHRGKYINADRNAAAVAGAFADTEGAIKNVCK